MKKLISLALALALALSLAGRALGADSSGAADEAHTLSGDYFIKTDGTLWKLSDEETGRPALIDSGIRSVYAGVRYQAVVKDDGSLRTDWGRNHGDPTYPGARRTRIRSSCRWRTRSM